MSARHSATVSFSFEEFSRRGGLTGPHKDGWGIAYVEGRDAQVIREPSPAASSPFARFIEKAPMQSSLVMSHIRRATRGRVALENTHPFARELGGRLHVFAHNGTLDLRDAPGLGLGRFRPIGETDSEWAFCALLARLETLWLGNEPPSETARTNLVATFARDLRRLGVANFLYSDGELLFAHAHERRQADGSVGPPGLHLLCQLCRSEPGEIAAEGFRLSIDAAADQSVVLLASVPLTGEGWEALGPGELVTIGSGTITSRTPAGAGG
jgi:glutamine amidotransferase